MITGRVLFKNYTFKYLLFRFQIPGGVLTTTKLRRNITANNEAFEHLELWTKTNKRSNSRNIRDQLLMQALAIVFYCNTYVFIQGDN